MRLRVLVEGAVAETAAASEEVLDESLEVRRNQHIGLVRRSRVMRLYYFACPPEPRVWSTLLVVEAYSIGGVTLYQWWRLKGDLAQMLRKCN